MLHQQGDTISYNCNAPYILHDQAYAASPASSCLPVPAPSPALLLHAAWEMTALVLRAVVAVMWESA
jgi:hypothetical protein